MSRRDFGATRDILRFEGRDRVAWWRRFSMLLLLAVVIATMGLVRDSAAVVIAAMLVAPLMTPILGIAAAIVMGWPGRALRLLAAVAGASALSVLAAMVLVWIADEPTGLRPPAEVLARTNPGAEDLVIALAAGVAGAYVQINRSQVSLLPGAAIGVSLVPPLSAAGILLHFGMPGLAFEALVLFATNFGAIVLAAGSVYLAIGPTRALLDRGRERMTSSSLSLAALAIFLAAVLAHLAQTTWDRFREARLEAIFAQAIVDWAAPDPVEVLRVDVDVRRRRAEVWVLVDLPPDAQRRLASTADLLPPHLLETPFRDVARQALGPDYTLVARYQTRISWQTDLRDPDGAPAPAPGPAPVPAPGG